MFYGICFVDEMMSSLGKSECKVPCWIFEEPN